MRRFIYNTQGTGISHEQIRRLERTQPGSGTYLEGDDMRGHLGDEIMLLDGLDGDDALEGMGYVRAGNYRSRAGYDMDEFSVSMGAVPSQRRAGRDYQPWGLGQAPAKRRAGRDFQPWGLGEGAVEYPNTPPPQTFFQAHEMEARLESFGQEPYEHWADTPDPGTWFQGLGAEVSPYTVDRMTRPDLFIGPNFYPLQDLPTPNVMRAGRDYQPWGLGDAAADRRGALAAAQLGKSGCELGCAAADMSAGERTRCRSVCQSIYDSAVAVINAAVPAGSTASPTADQSAAIQAKLDQLAAAQAQAEAGRVPDAGGLTTNQMLLIGAGVLGVGIIAVLALRK